MRPFIRSKKMAVFDTSSAAWRRLDNHSQKWSASA